MRTMQTPEHYMVSLLQRNIHSAGRQQNAIHTGVRYNRLREVILNP